MKRIFHFTTYVNYVNSNEMMNILDFFEVTDAQGQAILNQEIGYRLIPFHYSTVLSIHLQKTCN